MQFDKIKKNRSILHIIKRHAIEIRCVNKNTQISEQNLNKILKFKDYIQYIYHLLYKIIT